MRELDRIVQVLSKHKKEIMERFMISEIAVFGSYVKGKQKKGSDVDILVEFEKVPGLIGFIKIEEYLEELLGMKVDLVRKKAVREELKPCIFEEAVYV